MNENEWRQLVKNALNDDEAAFERLYKETERSVYFLCLKLLGNEQDVKDIVQETYLAAFNGLSTLDDGANFPKWINGIAVNQCKRFFRSPKSESLDEKLEHGMDFSDEENFIPDDYVTDAEKRRVIMNMIDTELSEVQRQTIILYYYNGLKTHEIASIMNCPEGTVKYRLSAAREKIKEAVLIYEKENKERLHAIVPIPILTLILRSEAEHTVVPDIRLFINPAASANHLKAGGKAIMKKALTGKIIAAAAAAVVVAGGGITAAIALNKNNDSNISGEDSNNDSAVSMVTDNDYSKTDSSVDNSSAAGSESSMAGESSGAENIKTEIDESDLRNWYIRFYRPSDFWPFPGSGTIFHMKTEKGNEICMIRESVDIFYLERHGVVDFELEDVPDIMDPEIMVDLGRFSSRFYYEIRSGSKFDVETEEEREVMDTTFLRRTGVIHAMAYGKDSGDYYYITYYGIIDRSINTGHYNAPICWTMVTDDKTQIPEIERIADTIAKYAERIEE